jgi:hypothetical protein
MSLIVTANVTIGLILVASCHVIIMAGHLLHQPDSPKINSWRLSLFLNAIFMMALFFITCDVTHCTMTLHSLLLGHHLYDPLTITMLAMLIKLMGLLVTALFLQCFLGLGSSSTFHHCCADCCADFFVCTDEYWHLDLIL